MREPIKAPVRLEHIITAIDYCDLQPLRKQVVEYLKEFETTAGLPADS